MENPETKEIEQEGEWKNKYFKALMEHDAAEKIHEERIGMFYKELLISFGHFRGRDQKLDQDLATLAKSTAADDVPIDTLKGLNRQIANILDLLAEGDSENEANNTDTELNPFGVAKDSLEYLIEKLPADISRELDPSKLRCSLEAANDVTFLRAIADDIKNALATVLNARNEKITELSKFLVGVAKRLDGLQSHLKEEKTGRRQSSDERGDLSKLVGNNLKKIRASVAEAESIDVLQKVIDSRLDEVGGKVTAFVEVESQRADKAEKSSAKLEVQLQDLQAQTGQLRESLQAALSDAMIDSLTGISNRRSYDERFKIEYARWKRDRKPLTLAIMDIDHFKNVNDTYGHPIGDKVLKVVAERIHKQVRESDFFGRIGGEEFAFLLVNSDIENSLEKVETLRKSVETCTFSTKQETFQVTISIGLATFNDKDTIETIYARADEALVKAKRTGRNKVLSEFDL